MKTILLIIICSYLFSLELLDDSMPIYTYSAESSAMGGVYRPYKSDEKLTFSHLSRFRGIYTLDVIKYNYKNNNIIFTSHGVNDIPNTADAWLDIDGNGEPSPEEIDYSEINYFNAKDFNLILSRLINNKYELSIKGTFSKIYNEYAVGLGLNIMMARKKFRKLGYYFGIYDLISFKSWSTSNLEYYNPKAMISFEYPIINSLNILTLYIDDKIFSNPIIDYRIGSKINLTDNLKIFFGNSNLNDFTIGFSLNNKLLNIDYSYMIPSSDLPFDSSYNIGIGIDILELSKKNKDFYP